MELKKQVADLEKKFGEEAASCMVVSTLLKMRDRARKNKEDAAADNYAEALNMFLQSRRQK